MPRITIPEAFEDAPLAYAVQHLAPELTGPLYDLSKAVYKHSILSLREFEAARARIAEINGCQICQKFRADRDVPGYLEGLGEDPAVGVHTHGPAPDEAFYRDVSKWKISPIYSEREKLAIEFSERFSLTPDALGYDDELWARLKAQFSEAEIYDLTISVGSLLASGRFVHVLGLDQASCAMSDALPRIAVAAE